MDDFVIRGKTIEHLVTFLFVIGIIVILNIFIIKYTGWFCDCEEAQCKQAEKEQSPAKSTAPEEQEKPILLDESEEEPIVIPERPVEVVHNTVKTPPKVQTPAQTQQTNTTNNTQRTSRLSNGEFELTIDKMDYDLVNANLSASDFVRMKSVTLTLDNNDEDFVPFLTFYLYDTDHRDNQNQYGESVYFDLLKKGEKKMYTAELKSLSLENVNVIKTLVVRVSNGADDTLIKREETSFSP